MFRPVHLISIWCLASSIGCAAQPTDADAADSGTADAGETRPDAVTDTRTHIVYLNFSGAILEAGPIDDATTNTSALGPAMIPALDGRRIIDGDYQTRSEAIRAIATLVAAEYEPFDVQVVTQRPAAGPFGMVVVGGTNTDLQPDRARCDNIGIASVVDCDDTNRRSVAFAFSACQPLGRPARSVRAALARTIVHESGHTFGLTHSASGGTMDPSGGSGWREGPVSGGPLQRCGRTRQDDEAVLRATLGDWRQRSAVPPPPDLDAPQVASTVPAEGDSIPPRTVPCFTSADTDLRYAMLQVLQPLGDGQYLLMDQQIRKAPLFDMSPIAAAASDVPYRFRFVLVDSWDNLTERVVTATIDAAATPERRCADR